MSVTEAISLIKVATAAAEEEEEEEEADITRFLPYRYRYLLFVGKRNGG